MAMPAALEIDREQVRIVAVSVGVREAARQFELNEDTVAAWSAREGWFKREAEVAAIQQQAIERKQERQGVKAAASKSAADVLKDYDGETRFSLAKGIAAGARTVAEMDGQEVLMAAQQVGTLVKSAALVHGWAQNIQTNLRLDVIASGSDLPVIDV
jgi:hypothetical protein